MAQADYTDIVVLLDRSGSMGICASGTIEGYNSYIAGQKHLPGKCLVSLIQFDDQYEPNYQGMLVRDVPPLHRESYHPRGWTALLGAVGLAIDQTGKRLADLSENDRPSKVLFVIITDGHENSSPNYNWSRAYTAGRVKEMVRHQTNKYSWQFIYLGANQDAFLESAKLGITTECTLNFDYTPGGVKKMSEVLCAATTNYRGLVGSQLSNYKAFDGLQHANDVNIETLNKLQQSVNTTQSCKAPSGSVDPVMQAK